jgi:hypothetical protein
MSHAERARATDARCGSFVTRRRLAEGGIDIEHLS